MAEPYYATATDLRTELGVNAGTLADAAAIKLLTTAEDWVDRIAGPGTVDTTTGRKYAVANLQPWQAAKLLSATVIIAAAIYRDPNVLQRNTFDRVQGPDFLVMTPNAGGYSAAAVEALERAAFLLDTGRLRRLFARPIT